MTASTVDINFSIRGRLFLKIMGKRTIHTLLLLASFLALPAIVFNSSVCFASDCAHLNAHVQKNRTTQADHCHRADTSSKKIDEHAQETSCCNDLVFDDSGIQNPSGFKLKPLPLAVPRIAFDHQTGGAEDGESIVTLPFVSSPPQGAPLYLLNRSLLI